MKSSASELGLRGSRRLVKKMYQAFFLRFSSLPPFAKRKPDSRLLEKTFLDFPTITRLLISLHLLRVGVRTQQLQNY